MCKICILLFGRLPAQGTLSQLLRCIMCGQPVPFPTNRPTLKNTPIAQSRKKSYICPDIEGANPPIHTA